MGVGSNPGQEALDAKREKINIRQFDGPQKIVEAFLRYKIKTETDNFINNKLQEKNLKIITEKRSKKSNILKTLRNSSELNSRHFLSKLDSM